MLKFFKPLKSCDKTIDQKFSWKENEKYRNGGQFGYSDSPHDFDAVRYYNWAIVIVFVVVIALIVLVDIKPQISTSLWWIPIDANVTVFTNPTFQALAPDCHRLCIDRTSNCKFIKVDALIRSNKNLNTYNQCTYPGLCKLDLQSMALNKLLKKTIKEGLINLNNLRSRHPSPCQPLSQVVQEWPTPFVRSSAQPEEQCSQYEATVIKKIKQSKAYQI